MNGRAVTQYAGTFGDPADIVAANERATALAYVRALLIGRPHWQKQGACRGSDLDFTSTSAKVISACIQLCGRCEVMDTCRGWADSVGDNHAVLGGESANARRARQHLEQKRQAS